MLERKGDESMIQKTMNLSKGWKEDMRRIQQGMGGLNGIIADLLKNDIRETALSNRGLCNHRELEFQGDLQHQTSNGTAGSSSEEQYPQQLMCTRWNETGRTLICPALTCRILVRSLMSVRAAR